MKMGKLNRRSDNWEIVLRLLWCDCFVIDWIYSEFWAPTQESFCSRIVLYCLFTLLSCLRISLFFSQAHVLISLCGTLNNVPVIDLDRSLSRPTWDNGQNLCTSKAAGSRWWTSVPFLDVFPQFSSLVFGTSVWIIGLPGRSISCPTSCFCRLA